MTQPDTRSYPAWRAAARDICREAGAMLGASRRDELQVSFKAGDEIVTNLDVTLERWIRKAIHDRFPAHRVAGEEEGLSGPDDGEVTWYIDPIDGTRNFAQGIPYYNISLGACEREVPVAGAVHDVLHGKIYSAQRGGGADCNQRAIHVEDRSKLDAAILLVDYHSADVGRLDPPQLQRLFRDIRKIRMLGAVALDLCLVAAGNADLLLGLSAARYKRMDLAAGWLILTEAGGVIEDLSGQPFTWSSPTLVAGNSELVRKLQSEFADILQ